MFLAHGDGLLGFRTRRASPKETGRLDVGGESRWMIRGKRPSGKRIFRIGSSRVGLVLKRSAANLGRKGEVRLAES